MSESAMPAPEPEDQVFEADLEQDVWVDDVSGPSLIGKMLAEVGGTFILVFMGVGTALFFSLGGNGTLTVGFGFALGVVIAATVFGGVSGAHLNPAITLAAWIAGRFPGRDVASYIIAQLVGAIAAGAILFALLSSHPNVTDARTEMSSAANGFGDHSPSGFDWMAGAIVEIIATGLLVAVVLAATSRRAPSATAPFTIGLTLGALLVVAIPFTNGALNPARALGAALFSESWAMKELVLFLVAPIIGAAIVGLLYRAFGPEEDLIIAEQVETLEQIED